MFGIIWLVKISISLVFIIFSYLQYNDPDTYIWASLYCLAAIFVFLKDHYLYYINTLIISLCSLLFIQNIHLLLTKSPINHELFYELGGIILILTLSYFKLKESL